MAPRSTLLLVAAISCLVAFNDLKSSLAQMDTRPNPLVLNQTTTVQAAEFAVEEHNKMKGTHLKLEKVIRGMFIGRFRVDHPLKMLLVITAKEGNESHEYFTLLSLDSWPVAKHMEMKSFGKTVKLGIDLN